jgi:hypothetical protein
MSEGGHGTGYEDAISRKIAAAETRAQEAEAALERERAQGMELARDNAKLRVRADQLERGAKRARLGAWLAWFLCFVAVAAAVVFALLWQGYSIPGIN